MFEVKPAQIARAVDILQYGPLTASAFAMKMWPDRGYSNGRASQAGHLLLRTLNDRGFVEHVGDLWTIRRISGRYSEPLPVSPSVGHQENLSERLREGLSDHQGDRLSEEQAERHRLGHLVSLADSPVDGVTHDVALGNLRIRGTRVDACISEACAFAVLRGRSLNVYPFYGEMLTALQPAEAARALFIRWRQSGRPPELPGRGWFLLDDGVATAPSAWRPQGAGREWREEPIVQRIARQRAAAGLGPPVGNGGSR